MPNYAPGGSEALTKALIKATESPNTEIEVYFNPKEITIDKPVPWQKHKNVEGNDPTLEFTAAEPKAFSCELMFDMFEERDSDTGADVFKTYIEPLETLTLIDDTLKRPPMCQFVWGGMPVFQGVIEDLNVKYTLFLPDGTPCRATVNLKMKQAKTLMNKQEAEEANKKAAQKKQAGDGTTNPAQTSSTSADAHAAHDSNTQQGAPPNSTGQPTRTA